MGTLERPLAVAVASFVIVLTATGSPAETQPGTANTPPRQGIQLIEGESDRLCLGVGVFDLLQEGYTKTTRESVASLLEYRFGSKVLFAGPLLGVLANTDGGVYGYGGIFFDVGLGPLRFSPMFSAGGYRRGGSKRLGGVFQFQETANLSYELESGPRVGFEFHHISNANIQHENPGAELVLFTLTFPLS